MLTANLATQDVDAATGRIQPYVTHTPVIWSHAASRLFDTPVCFKCEQLQKTGTFNARGACNAVFSLTEEALCNGVVAHSSANHAAALAYAARARAISATVVVPWTTAPKKLERIREYAPCVEFCEPTMKACEFEARRLASETSATVIPSSDDLAVIAGNATAALEFVQETPNLDLLVLPIGEGGLLAGTLIATEPLRPDIEVWGAEPRMADDAYRGWKTGQFTHSTHPPTMADELRGELGRYSFSVITNLVDDIIPVDEEEIRQALAFLWYEAGMPVEPSSAVAFAALTKQSRRIHGKRVGIILTGGNFDPTEARALSR